MYTVVNHVKPVSFKVYIRRYFSPKSNLCAPKKISYYVFKKKSSKRKVLDKAETVEAECKHIMNILRSKKENGIRSGDSNMNDKNSENNSLPKMSNGCTDVEDLKKYSVSQNLKNDSVPEMSNRHSDAKNLKNYSMSENLENNSIINKLNRKSKAISENLEMNSSSASDILSNNIPRKNELNIQMLSGNLHSQIFGDNDKMNVSDPELMEKAKTTLKQHGLWKDDVDFLEDVSLNLPSLKGENIEEHFKNIGEEQAAPYRKLVNKFIKNGIPKPPKNWLTQKGWTKYVPGMKPEAVSFPDDEALVFDVEVCVKLGELPTLATAVSESAWYGWVSGDLGEGINPVPSSYYNTSKLIPLEGKSINKDSPRIIVGHNVSYDRSKIKEQYYFKESALRFLDTMSLHICIGGISKSQKTLLKHKSEEDDYESWRTYSCLSSLKDVYALYCNQEMPKEKRNVFLNGTLEDIRSDFQELMNYCSNDVKATFEVLQAIFPVYLHRFPHPVTFAGMLEMGTAFLPVTNNWKKFLADADQTYDDLRSEMTVMLSKKSDNACKLFHNDMYKNDLWMWNENWSTQELKFKKIKSKTPKEVENEKITKMSDKESEEDEELEELSRKYQHLFDKELLLHTNKPFLPGYPLWYRKLCEKPDSLDWIPNAQLSTGMQVTPKLLRLTWENFPLYHTQEFGWGILLANIFAKDVDSVLPFQKLKELTLLNCKISEEKIEAMQKNNNKKSNNPVPFYKGSAIWCDHTVDGCSYFLKLPHKDGPSKNVGNPLSKDFIKIYSNSVLGSSDSTAEMVMDMGKKLTYWRNNRERIMNQMVVWLNQKEKATFGCVDEEASFGVIIPKVVVCGTLTRRAMEATWLTASKTIENRIGSEIRSMIEAPSGYHFVGADVDSQELWIASLIGDSYFAKVHGSTPFGWMTLSGSKSCGTDMHSMTAKAIGISRDHAKIINYARIYGAGTMFAQKLLLQFNPSMTKFEAQTKAAKMHALTKGRKLFKVKDSMVPAFQKRFGTNKKLYEMDSAFKLAHVLGKKMGEVFEKCYWVGGTESAMFNQLEKIASSLKPVTPFLQCRLSRALEPKFQGDSLHLNTRVNWVVQSGAVDFLHLMLVCMRWLTNGQARYCFSFHDEIRYLIPSKERYNAALAMHVTNLLVRSFCAHRLGIYDLPQSVAFFSSVEIDKTLRKEADDDCITPSNPHGMEKGYGISPGESLNIYQTIEKSGGDLLAFTTGKNQKCLEQQKESMSTEKSSKGI